MNKIFQAIMLILFSVGVIAGMTFAIFTTIAALEANTYWGYVPPAKETLRLLCPRLIDHDETGTVSIQVTNDVEKEIEPLVWTVISDPGIFSSYSMRLSIPPGENQTLNYSVSKDDRVFKYLILVKVIQYAAFKTPMRNAFCGILVMDLPFNGNTVLIATLVISLLGMLAGVVMWITLDHSHPLDRVKVTRAMVSVLVCITIAMALGWLKIWLLAVLTIAISFLMIGEVVRSFIAAK